MKDLAFHLAAQRSRMLNEHLIGRGIKNDAVLAAMMTVPREEFVAEQLRASAYEDHPLPIDAGQTISQPYIVAYMTEKLELSAEDRVLEIGTGSGYAAAILSRIVKTVYTVEHFAELARKAVRRFEKLGYTNVHVLEADGTLGWPEHAPYDAIVVTAGAPEVPAPLLEQLAEGGRLVIPVGDNAYLQNLVRVRRRSNTDYLREVLCAVRFVPLVGSAGWPA
jgi:protein-L-isoaspartate(D-aspartate) O-methyltransferase